MTVVLLCIMISLGVAGFIILNEKWQISRRIKKKPVFKHNLSKSSNADFQQNDAAKGNKLPADYNQYSMTFQERLKYTILAFVVLFAVGYIFFKSIPICIVLCLFSPVYPHLKKQDLIKERKNTLNTQFKDALYSVSSSLSAGKSVEASIRSVPGDLKILYPDNNAIIIQEFEQLCRRLDMNDTIEEALLDLASRTKIDDITNFVDVFTICRNTGGNLIEVIKNTALVINQKIEIKGEIDVLVSEQKLSQKVLSIMPFGLLILLITGSPDYIAPLYSTKGHLVMLVVLIMLLISYFISSKIMDIKI